MERCINCGSCAINHHLFGREQDEFTDLCDVCYWRARYKKLEKEHEAALERIDTFMSIDMDY